MSRQDLAVLITSCLVTLASSVPAMADTPRQFLGTWSTRCDDPDAPRMEVAVQKVAIKTDRQYSYAGIDVSYTWIGGAKATGNNPWLLVSKTPGAPFEFVVGPPVDGSLILEEGHPDKGKGVKALFGNKFHRCDNTVRQQTVAAAPTSAGGRNWTAKREYGGVTVAATAGDGRSKLTGACDNKLLAPGLWMTFYYTGDALPREDRRRENFNFEVMGGPGGAQSFPVELEYAAPEDGWVMKRPLPTAFLDVFAQGQTLTVRERKGEPVGVFGLNGSANVVRTIRQGCAQ
jgi:hypothetical protein